VDGTPLVVLDVDDIVRSIEQVVTGGRLSRVGDDTTARSAPKRVLVVDDSITVREVERKLLESAGSSSRSPSMAPTAGTQCGPPATIWSSATSTCRAWMGSTWFGASARTAGLRACGHDSSPTRIATK